MTALRVPADDVAEDGLIGCCVDSDSSFRLAASRVTRDDFYTPRNRRLWDACARMGDLSGADLDTAEARLHQAAHLSGVRVDAVRRIVEDRPLQRDINGTLAARVRRAAEARRLMEACVATYNRLGAGEPLEAVLAEIGPEISRHLVGGRAS